MAPGAPPAWHSPAEAARTCLYRPNLIRTVVIAIVVGSLLALINQAGPLLHGPRPPVLWIRLILDYLVPLAVSNLGVLTASRQPKLRLRGGCATDANCHNSPR